MLGLFEDVTERKQAVQALKDSEALNRAVLNSLPANIAVLKADGKIQVDNEAWRRFAQANGAHPPGVADTGTNYLEGCKRAAADGSEDAQKALAGIQDVLAGLLPSFEMQYPLPLGSPKRDGFICWSLAWLGPSVARL